jgi:hypothetical protein
VTGVAHGLGGARDPRADETCDRLCPERREDEAHRPGRGAYLVEELGGAPGSTGRMAVTIAMGAARMLPARCPIALRDDLSAQWASSIVSSSGPRAATSERQHRDGVHDREAGLTVRLFVLGAQPQRPLRRLPCVA